ncbi:hypothetical protein BDV3_006246 [Batrachochytrium dendrobatidis]
MLARSSLDLQQTTTTPTLDSSSYQKFLTEYIHDSPSISHSFSSTSNHPVGHSNLNSTPSTVHPIQPKESFLIQSNMDEHNSVLGRSQHNRLNTDNDYFGGSDFQDLVDELDHQDDEFASQPFQSNTTHSLLYHQTVTKEINPFHIQSVNPLHDIAEEGESQMGHVALDDSDLSQLDLDDFDPNSKDVDSDQNTDITHAHDDVVETHDADQTELMTRMMMEEHSIPRIEGITDIDLSDLEQDLFNGSTNGNSDELEIELDELPSILSNHHQYLDTTHDRIQSTVDVQLPQTNLHKSTSWTTTVNHQLDSEYSPHAQFQTSIGSNRSASSTHSQGWIPLHTQHAHMSSRSSHDVSETGQTLNHNHPIQNIHNSVQPLQYVGGYTNPSTPNSNSNQIATPCVLPSTTKSYLDGYAPDYGGSTTRDLHDMLFEARSECQSLRALNERLLQANSDHHQQLNEIQLEHERALNAANATAEDQIKRIQGYEKQKQELLQEKINTLDQDLTQLQTTTKQISQIRASLQREKELEVLTIKKELLGKTERHLVDMRQEMALGRKELQKTYQQEIDNEAAKAEELKTRLKTVCDERDAALQNAIELKRQMTEKSDLVAKVDGLVSERAELISKVAEMEYAMEQIWTIMNGSNSSNAQPQSNFASSTSSSGTSKSLRRSGSRPKTDFISKDQVILKCKELVEQHEATVANLRADLSVKTEQMQSIKDELTIQMQDTQSHLETQHRRVLDALKRAHMAELAQTKVTLEASLSMAKSDEENSRNRMEANIRSLSKHVQNLQLQLKSKTENGSKRTNSPLDHPVIPDSQVTLTELAARFPTQLNQYRSGLESQLRRHMNAMALQAHSDEIASLKADHAQTLQLLTAQHEQERQTIVNRHQAEIVSVSTRLKEQCSAAYDTAITKLKDEYLRLEGLLVKKFTGEKELYVDRLEKRAKMDIDRMKEETSRNVLASVQVEYDAKIATLEKSLQNAQSQSLSQLQTIKEKYIATVRRMRDELAQRKEDGWRRLETEWVKRRRVMNDEWLRRLDNFKVHCDVHHAGCRCTVVIAALQKQNDKIKEKEVASGSS